MIDVNEVQERTLTVISYNPEAEKGEPKKARVTLAPSAILFIIASDETSDVVDGVEVRKVNVILHGENNLEVFVSSLDLAMLERAIGAYFLP